MIVLEDSQLIFFIGNDFEMLLRIARSFPVLPKSSHENIIKMQYTVGIHWHRKDVRLTDEVLSDVFKMNVSFV